MSDDRLRKLERAALSTPDDMEAFLRWRAELRRIQPSAFENEHYGGVVRVERLTVGHAGLFRVGEATLHLIDIPGGPLTIALPMAADSFCRRCIFKKIDPSGNPATVIGHSSETIDGAHGRILTTQYEAIEVACDGVAWWIA